jgi:hypothetical protein
LRTAPSDQAVRDALTALCPYPAPLEQRLNRLFTAQIPKGLRKRPQCVAIDLTLVPTMVNPTSASKGSTACLRKVSLENRKWLLIQRRNMALPYP